MPKGTCLLCLRFLSNRPDEIKSLFGKYGPVTDAYMPLDYYTRRSRGFAYIQYPLAYKVYSQHWGFVVKF